MNSRSLKKLTSLTRRLAVRAAPKPKPLVRASSFPFISGDTYRSMSEVLIEGETTIHRSQLHNGIIFADGVTASKNSFVDRLAQAVQRLENPRTKLIIHNTDEVPSQHSLAAILQVVPTVFSKNILDGVPGLVPIPIGLENASLNHNGKLHYYYDALDGRIPEVKKTRRVLSSFHSSTNPQVREAVADLFRQSEFGHEDTFRKSLDYRLEVQKTRFVISPPGNGPDCHRTWEAIYLGAVPVVLEGSLAGSLSKDLPILAVNNYEEFLGLSSSDMDVRYRELRSKSLTKAFMPYWISLLLR